MSDQITIIETIKGAKNRHPQIRFRCVCGNERTARATKVRNGFIAECASCAKAAAAKRGGDSRRLPEPERSLRDRWSQYKVNAKRSELPMVLSFDEAAALMSQPCSYCGGNGGGIDRIDSSLGYVASNVVACCSVCNYAKRDMPLSVFLSWVERIYEHQSLLQRDRSILLRMVEQPDGRRVNSARNDQQQVDCRFNPGRGEAP